MSSERQAIPLIEYLEGNIMSNAIVHTTNKSFQQYGLPYRVTSLIECRFGWKAPVDVLLFLRNEHPLRKTQEEMVVVLRNTMLREPDLGPRRTKAVMDVLIDHGVI